MSHANLCDANVEGTVFAQTIFANVDLSNVRGLESIKHWGPSDIGVQTLYKSHGKIPEVFLRDCGVPEDFIT